MSLSKSARPETMWTVLYAVLALLLIGGIIYAIQPKPTPAQATSAKAVQERELIREAAVANAEEAALRKANAELIWHADPEAIQSAALASVAKMTQAAGVKMTAFRPQRSIEGVELQQLPYLLLVEGRYPAVLSLIKNLETQANRLSLNSVTLTSSDASSDNVTGSIVLSAYRELRTQEAKN